MPKKSNPSSKIIQVIWEKNQDLTFGEINQASVNILKAVNAELGRVRREKKLKEIKRLTEAFLDDVAGGVHQDDQLLNGGPNEEYLSLTNLRRALQ